MARRFVALLAWAGVLAVLIAAQPALAQVPGLPPIGTEPYSGEVLSIQLVPDQGATDVPRLGQAYIRVLVKDRSDTNVESRATVHTVNVVPTLDPQAVGWSTFLDHTNFQTKAGDDVAVLVVVQPSATVRTIYARIVLTATMSTSTGFVTNATTELLARVLPFSLASVDISASPQHVPPFEQARIPVSLRNEGLYPETYRIEALGPKGWLVSSVAQLTLFPGEEGTLFVNLLTPADRVLVPEETGVITVRAHSTLEPGVVYERATVAVVEGFYFPDYWSPVLLLGVVVGGLVVRRSVAGGRRSAREQGRPGSRRLTPAQRVMLAELKARDPERYKLLVARQRRSQKVLQRRFEQTRGRRGDIERAMVDRQHAEARHLKAEEKARARAIEERERELERARNEVERARSREERDRLREQRGRDRALRSLQRKQAAREARAARREARHPEVRRREREQRKRERALRAELAKKRSTLRKQQRLRKVAADRRRRQLLKQKRLLERRAKRKERRRGKRGQGPEEGG